MAKVNTTSKSVTFIITLLLPVLLILGVYDNKQDLRNTASAEEVAQVHTINEESEPTPVEASPSQPVVGENDSDPQPTQAASQA